jgi:hypothetical protein
MSRKIKQLEQIKMGSFFELALETNSLRMLGCFWKKYCRAYFDKSNGDFIIEYE